MSGDETNHIDEHMKESEPTIPKSEIYIVWDDKTPAQIKMNNVPEYAVPVILRKLANNMEKRLVSQE